MTTSWNGPKLYEGKARAADVCQGLVGDCWLVAALACAAECPACIQNVLVTREYNPRGKYIVRLFLHNKWRQVLVDDVVPVGQGTMQVPPHREEGGRDLENVYGPTTMAMMGAGFGPT